MGVNKIYLSEARDFVSKALENVADEEFMLGLVDLATVGGPYFVYTLFCNVPLILYDSPFLKLQNNGNILCIHDSDSKILRF